VAGQLSSLPNSNEPKSFLSFINQLCRLWSTRAAKYAFSVFASLFASAGDVRAIVFIALTLKPTARASLYSSRFSVVYFLDLGANPPQCSVSVLQLAL
jgi:hypothetical protein